MTTAVRTGTVMLRIKSEIETSGAASVSEVIEALSDIQRLLVISSYLARDQPDYPLLVSSGFLVEEAGWVQAEEQGQAFRVVRLTLNSPLDILLEPHIAAAAASTAISTVALACWKAADLWEKVNRARVNHHKANAQVEAYKLVREEVVNMRRGRAVILGAQRDDLADPISTQIEQAVAALLRAEDVEVIEDGYRPTEV